MINNSPDANTELPPSRPEPQSPPQASTDLRAKLKDDIEVLLKDYLRDNLGNWRTKPTPERIEEYLRFHMPGYTREAFAKLFDAYAATHLDDAVLAELNAIGEPNLQDMIVLPTPSEYDRQLEVIQWYRDRIAELQRQQKGSE